MYKTEVRREIIRMLKTVAYRGGWVWGGVQPPPPRNSEGPPNRAKLNPIVKIVKSY